MAAFDLKSLKITGDWGAVLTKAPPLANVIMVILVAQSLAILTWKLVPSPSLPEPPVSATKTVVANTVGPANSVVRQDVASWHLFGEVPKEVPKPVEAEPVVPEEAPDTRLSLNLLGVLAGAGDDSVAIISDRSGNEEIYRIESPLPGGATLKEIYADRVILLHNGRYETLRLPQDRIETGAVSTAPSSSSRFSSRRSSPPPVTPSTGAVTRLGDEATQLVKQYKQALMTDPQSVMDTVRAEPYRQGGQLKGYRIFPGRDKDLMGKVGLLPGDVVVAVNGIELDSPLKGLEIMQQVQNASEVSVDVLRNGVTQTFMVPLN